MNEVRILLSIELKENRRLLEDYLGQYHHVTLLDSEETLTEPFDLGIFDGAMLTRLWKHVQTRKEVEKTLFLPILLVTTRQGLTMITRQLWRSIDEIIFTPIEKNELLARVEVLLRVRRLSLELASRNIELRQEIVAHKIVEEALRESEERGKLLQSLTAELATVITPLDLSNLIADKVLPAVGGHMGTLGTVREPGKSPEILGIKGLQDDILDQYQHMSLEMPVLLTEVIRTGEPLWIETFEEYVSRFPHLEPIISQTKTQAAAVLPLIVNEQTLGAVKIFFPQHKHFSEEDRVFFLSLARQFAQALERAHLYEEVRENAALEERQRLARDLHDDISQSLASINMMGQTLPRMWEKNPERARELLQDISRLTQAATSGIRVVLFELRPSGIMRSSLRDLFEQLINTAQGRLKMTASCIVEIEQPLPEDVHFTIYRIVQEGLNNIVKHSGATEVSISLKSENGNVVLRIKDNGKGFDTRLDTHGLGLGGMRERAALIGASYEVFSANAHGTEIVVTWSQP